MFPAKIQKCSEEIYLQNIANAAQSTSHWSNCSYQKTFLSVLRDGVMAEFKFLGFITISVFESLAVGISSKFEFLSFSQFNLLSFVEN